MAAGRHSRLTPGRLLKAIIQAQQRKKVHDGTLHMQRVVPGQVVGLIDSFFNWAAGDLGGSPGHRLGADFRFQLVGVSISILRRFQRFDCTKPLP